MKSKMEGLENEKVTKDEKIKTLETKIQYLETRIQSLENDKSSKDRRLRKIEDKPYAFQCAYQSGWTTPNSTITWDRLITDTTSGVTGGFSLSTGEFTVGHSGVWEVTFSMHPWLNSDEEIEAYLYINGRKLTESQYDTTYYNSEGWVGSLGSRTLFIKLNKGDKVTLRTGTLTGDGLLSNTLCFHLAQPL